MVVRVEYLDKCKNEYKGCVEEVPQKSLIGIFFIETMRWRNNSSPAKYYKQRENSHKSRPVLSMKEKKTQGPTNCFHG
jgi:hypothetical protein